MIEGPEEDVLARFVKAATELGLAPDDIIVRITADDPLKQPELIKMAVAHADPFGDTNHWPGMVGLGAQAFRVSMLTGGFVDAEHVLTLVPVSPNDATVDTPEDLARLEALCAGW